MTTNTFKCSMLITHEAERDWVINLLGGYLEGFKNLTSEVDIAKNGVWTFETTDSKDEVMDWIEAIECELTEEEADEIRDTLKTEEEWKTRGGEREL